MFPIAEHQFAGGELVDDDPLAGESLVASPAQHLARRVRAPVVLDDAIDRTLQQIAQLLDETRGICPSPSTPASRCC